MIGSAKSHSNPAGKKKRDLQTATLQSCLIHICKFVRSLYSHFYLCSAFLIAFTIPSATNLRDMADPEARRAWVNANVDSDLQHLWQESGVSEQSQYDIGQLYKSTRLFTAIADDRASLRNVLRTDFGLGTDNAVTRAQIASVVAAWEAAKIGAEEQVKMRMEAQTMGLERPLPQTDRTAMLRALETARGDRIADKDQPSSEYLAQLLEAIENDEPTAFPLDEVVSKAEATTLQLQTTVDPTGKMRVTRKRGKGKLPQTTEELRQKLRVEANAWLMITSKCRNRSYLRNLEPRHFERYVDYLLGEKCYLLPIPDSSGSRQPLCPPWHVVLNYEYEVRKKAVREAHRQNIPLGTMLQTQWESSELKELYFTSPAAMERPLKQARLEQDPSSTNANSLWSSPGYTSFKGAKGAKGKGKKGKNKGKGKTWDSQEPRVYPGSNHELVTHTPDGREICYTYSIKGKTCNGRCNRIHICRIKGCNSKHPTYECPKLKETNPGGS